MSTNAELARLFEEMAAVLELTGANSFRVAGYARAARVLEDLTTDVATIADHAKLIEIEGIGEGTAKRILQYIRTGRIPEHDELLAKVPIGLLEVMRIPGIGPKTARILWEKGGITDLASLREKLEAGGLEGLPRMGDKTIANIRESISFMEGSRERTRLGQALPLAEAIVERLRALPGVRRVEYAGSLRRGAETIGDIDLLASCDRPAALSRAFVTMPGIVKVLAAGTTKSSVRLETGIQVDLRVIDEESFGAALMYFTGNKAHNIEMRERAAKRGMRLNEYGLFRPARPGDGPPEPRAGEPVASAREEDIFAALGLPWIPPELREDRGELELTETPRLIEVGDIRCDLHAHTIASDGRMTIDELAAEARRRGYHAIAVTDHSPASPLAGGLSPDDLLRHIDAVREAAGRTKGIAILAGSEVDIHADGRLDYDDEILARLDVVVASPHAALRQSPDVATKRLVAAVRHPLVRILGHPTGRLINKRAGLQPDLARLVEAAAETGVALEINANDLRLDLRDVHVRAAMDGGALLAIDTDVHSPGDFDLLRYGVLTARRGGLTPDRCVNTWTLPKLRAWLKR